MSLRRLLSCFHPLIVGIFVLTALLSSPRLRAQNYIGFYPPVLIGVPDTVTTGDSIIAGAVLGNISPVAYNDTITIAGYVDTGNGNVPFLFTIFPQITIGAYDTIPMVFIFPVTDANQQGGAFRIGGNVIVIWPIVSDPQFSTGDSIVVPIYVRDGTGIDERVVDETKIRCYPNPTLSQLHIVPVQGQEQPEYIIVRDLQARVVYSSPFSPLPINTENWLHGTYILECQFENGTRSYVRIIR